MNQQRINELAVEAGAYWRPGYVEQPNGDLVWQERVNVDMVDMDLNKYTRLVVQECADFLTDDLDYPDAALRLKQHFGVKE